MQVTQFTDQRISRTWETPNPLAIIRAHVGDYEDTPNHNKHRLPASETATKK